MKGSIILKKYKKRNIMKMIFFIIIKLIILNFCTGAGLSDWSYILPNGYEMWRINSSDIRVGFVGENRSSLSMYNGNIQDGTLIGIPPHIIEFGYNEKYVCAKIIQNISNVYLYYILDTETRYVYEFSEEFKFYEKLNELKIEIEIKNLNQLIKTEEIKIKYGI